MQNATETSSSQGILETTTNSEWKEAQNTDMYQRGPPGAYRASLTLFFTE